MNPAVTLIARVLLSILFIVSGFGKLAGAAGFAGYLGSLGVPGGVAMAYLVGLFELLGGLAVLVGFQTRIVGYALAAFCVATGLLAHLGPDQSTQLMKNLGLAGGFLLLAAGGAGAYSVDARKR
ncbi:DoxX family protein [Aureimonas pseudogalii]|jgi:putative oxidoreductase|uniref:Putative oxidoreductase n=1 Tax=Aureimonas pseudogalii TaxID=1744844 RepID=A0A7W6H3A0_9HYPH|nr:DoxX family protein [Aureimonas pseudogalii]MBB3996648.1 putative oxidoreductase [Aureimonas pseudogalii]